MVLSGQQWQGAAFLIISVFGTRFLSMYLGFSDNFEGLSIFAKDFNTVLSNSLGDLLINIVLLLWVMAFFHKEFPVRPYKHLSNSMRFGVTTLNYIAIFSAIVILTVVFKTLVFNTNLNFDFDNVFSLDTHSLLANRELTRGKLDSAPTRSTPQSHVVCGCFICTYIKPTVRK